MKPFEYYLHSELVKKSRKDIERARSLINDARGRMNDLKLIEMEKLPKMFFEYAYDALRDFCDAVLLLDGYKSFSHEASIVYLSKKGFDVAILGKLDRFRYKRNGSKYYGVPITITDAKDIKKFYLEIKEKLNKILTI